MDKRKSAEVIRAAAQSGKGPNVKRRTGAERSMSEGGAARRSEMTEPPREEGCGTAHGLDEARQADTACKENTSDESGTLMKEVLRRENLVTAYQKVKRNKGAPGVDGMTVDELLPHCRCHWPAIKKELAEGTYQPAPVRQVEIPKPGGKGKRKLGIPIALDRLICQGVQQVLTPIFDPTFSDGSFGFRPGRRAHDALERAREHIAAGHRWSVTLDLEDFFNRVNHDVLMVRVAKRVKDKRVLRLIRRYLQAGVLAGGLVSPRSEGTPQGSPLSPLLSNILLDDLDKELEQRGHRFCRYGDDIIVFVRSKAAGERVMRSLERFVSKRLRLKVNLEKSAVARPWTRRYLGYSFTNHLSPKLKVASESVKRLKRKLQPIFRRGRGRSLESTVRTLNLILRGWAGYYRKAQVKGSLEQLDSWIRRKLRCIRWRQWKTPRTRFNKLRRLGANRSRAAKAAWNGRGPWWNAGASHMNLVLPNDALRNLGLVSLLDEVRRLASSS